jgi:hypothetical protein
MAAKRANPGEWMPAFHAALAEGRSIKRASRLAGISPGTAYYYKQRNAEFAAQWSAGALQSTACGAPGAWEPGPPRHAGWRKAFFEALAETSNVTAAAARAGIPLRTVYKTKRDDAGFAARWLAALHEGYDLLELELLGYLRDRKPERKMDVAAALRLLAAHRETVERRRALSAEEDEEALLESIDRFIDDMRERRAANEAILAEDGGAEGEPEAGHGAE